MRKKLYILILAVIGLAALTSCLLNKSKDPVDNNTSEYEQLAEKLQIQIDRKQDDYLTAENEKSLKELIKLDSVTYGNFTDDGVSEILALFKCINIPHAGGLDRTIAVIYDADTYKLKNQKTFVADNVDIRLLKNANHRDCILYIGTVTYQGYTNYDIQLLQVEPDGWVLKDVSDEKFPNNYAFFFTDNVLQVFELTYSEYNPVYTYKHTLYWNGIESIFKKTLQ